jgi:hypothetical protein
MFAMFLYLTLYLQDILELSPLQAGLRFLPLTLLAFFVPAATRALTARLPARVPLGIGLALVGCGLLLMRGIDVDSGWTTLLAGFVVAGFGIGLSNPSIASTALGVVAATRSGMASGISNTVRISGVATGIAALGAVFQGRIESRLADLLPGSSPELADTVAAAGTRAAQASPTGSRPQVADAIREAFVSSLNDILLIGGATLLLGSLAAFALIRDRDFEAQPGSEPATA